MSIVSITNVKVDGSNATKGIENVVNDDYTRTMIHALLAQTVDPWVPYDTGYLSKGSVEIDETGVIYTADYAWRQYYGENFNHKREVHPLATAFWDKVAMETQFDAFAEGVKEIIIRRYNSGQE